MTVKIKKGKFRQFKGHLRTKISPRQVSELNVSRAIDNELWCLLEYYSEIKEVGIKLFKNYNKRNTEKYFKYFQAYVRQAKSYYDSAKTLKPRSSSLLYYYSFLNLSKAAIIIDDPSVGGKIHHGLVYDLENDLGVEKQKVKILDDGVFPKLYEWYFDHKINSQFLNVNVLLSYCTDIGYQYRKDGSQQRKILPCVHLTCVNRNECWSLVGMPGFDLFSKFKKSMSDFFKDYELVEIPKHIGANNFNMSPIELDAFSFFQNKEPISLPSDNRLSDRFEINNLVLALKKLFQTNYFSDNYDFQISLPYMLQKQVQIDETLSIYLIMFFLSSLVRYKPHYLENLLNSKDAWLIDSFVNSCPTTFLRSLVSRTIGEDYLLSSR